MYLYLSIDYLSVCLFCFVFFVFCIFSCELSHVFPLEIFCWYQFPKLQKNYSGIIAPIQIPSIQWGRSVVMINFIQLVCPWVYPKISHEISHYNQYLMEIKTWYVMFCVFVYMHVRTHAWCMDVCMYACMYVCMLDICFVFPSGSETKMYMTKLYTGWCVMEILIL